MCLSITKNSSKVAIATRRGRKPIIAYKELVGDYSPYQRFAYINGVNISNRDSTKLEPNEIYYNSVYEGFHCFLSKKGAKKHASLIGLHRDVYEVTIDPKDVVAIGNFEEVSGRYRCIVSTKLTMDFSKLVK